MGCAGSKRKKPNDEDKSKGDDADGDGSLPPLYPRTPNDPSHGPPNPTPPLESPTPSMKEDKQNPESLKSFSPKERHVRAAEQERERIAALPSLPLPSRQPKSTANGTSSSRPEKAAVTTAAPPKGTAPVTSKPPASSTQISTSQQAKTDGGGKQAANSPAMASTTTKQQQLPPSGTKTVSASKIRSRPPFGPPKPTSAAVGQQPQKPLGVTSPIPPAGSAYWTRPPNSRSLPFGPPRPTSIPRLTLQPKAAPSSSAEAMVAKKPDPKPSNSSGGTSLSKSAEPKL